MAYTQRPNSGSLFKNQDKDPGNVQHEKWADYEGTAQINGQEFFVNAWIKRPEGKKTFLSLAFKSKGQPRQQSAEAQQRPPARKPAPPRDPDPNDNPDPDYGDKTAKDIAF